MARPKPDAVLHLGDCLEVLGSLPDGSVDAVITDPPYGTTCLRNDVSPDWSAWWREVRRVARPDAAFVVFSAMPTALDVVAANRSRFRYELIWHKNIATGFLDANRRPLRSHELVLIFGRGFMYNRVDWPRTEFLRRRAASTIAVIRAPSHHPHYGRHDKPTAYVYGATQCPKSVLPFPRRGNTAYRSDPDYHPTRKPVALMEWLVRSYSAEGQTVLDPYMGSGSTGVACAATGRRFVGVEIDPEYHAVARRRIDAALAEQVSA